MMGSEMCKGMQDTRRSHWYLASKGKWECLLGFFKGEGFLSHFQSVDCAGSFLSERGPLLYFRSVDASTRKPKLSMYESSYV